MKNQAVISDLWRAEQSAFFILLLVLRYHVNKQYFRNGLFYYENIVDLL